MVDLPQLAGSYSPGASPSISDPGNGRGVPTLSLIVPTLNEAKNIPTLVRWLEKVLRGIAHEIVVVDDSSSDGTADVAESLRGRHPSLRVLRRTRNFGLSAAIIDGFRNARGDLLGVMDADLQHDPRILPGLVAALVDHDVAVGSRYAFRGRTRGWSWLREAQSRLASWVTRQSLRLSTKDPLSGFFVLRRSVFEEVESGLSNRGWKVLLEILASAPYARVAEVPFTFRPRRQGQTKMSWHVVAAWLGSVVDLRRARRGRRPTEYRSRGPRRVALP
jgi:dolichol-phosphate mannosyltransferase